MAITGLIKPPPDIRAVVHKTAQFVAKNGRAFEQKILARGEGKSTKFAFLESASPFHAYYEDRVLFYQNNESSKDATSKAADEKKEREDKEKEKGGKPVGGQEVVVVSQRQQKASAVDAIAKALLAQRQIIKSAYQKRKENETGKEVEEAKAQTQAHDGNGDSEVKGGDFSREIDSSSSEPEKPRDFNFVGVVVPANLTLMEIDTIKTVAQFSALASTIRGLGGGFLDSVMRKEVNNPMYEFLKPRHTLFPYFSGLVENYKKNLRRDDDHTKFLIKCGAADGASSYCLETAAYRCEYNRDKEEKRREEEDKKYGRGILGGSALVDWHDFVIVETIDFPIHEIVQPLQLQPVPLPLQPPALSSQQVKEEEVNDDMDESGDEMEESDDEGEKLKVVPNYTPKVVGASKALADTSRTHAVDPLTGKTVALADMPEHMRIQLLDPKWAEEKRRFMDKQKESNFVAGDAMASNINRFAQQRQDIFGSTAEEKALRASESSKNPKNEEETENNSSKLAVNHHQPALLPQPAPSIQQPLNHTSMPAPSVANYTNPTPPPPPMGFPPAGFPPVLQQPHHQGESLGSTLPPPIHTMSHPRPDNDLPNAKKARIDGSSLSEEDFVSTLASPIVRINISLPNDSSYSQWNLNGRTIPLDIDVRDNVKMIKQKLGPELGNMPSNKMQLKNVNDGTFLKDNQTLAALNIGPSGRFELVPRKRGRK